MRQAPHTVVTDMRFAEVLLKLGVSLVGWIVVYAHILWLAVAGKVACGPDGDEVFRVLLGLSPLTLVCIWLLRASRSLGDVHRTLLWASLPLLLLSPFALKAFAMVAASVNLHGRSICGPGPPALWEQIWAPAQLLVLTIAAVVIVRMWRSGGRSEAAGGES